MQPTLLIGLGGTGIHVATLIHANLLKDAGVGDMIDGTIQVLCIDTDTRFVQDQNLGLPTEFVQNIGFHALPFLEQACRDDENLQKWFSCACWQRGALQLSHPDLQLGAKVIRQLGRLCLYHDLAAGIYSKTRRRIHDALQIIQQRTAIRPLVIVCASLIGGTGSAMALDIAYLVRHILSTMNYSAHIVGVFALSNVFSAAILSSEYRIRSILNQVAAMKEIQYFARTKYEFGPDGNVITYNNLEPFNSYWLFGGDEAARLECQWPRDYFPLIAAEIFDAILSSDWMIPPQRLKYVKVQAPLATNTIGDWSLWERVYEGESKDPYRLSPHISREFDRYWTRGSAIR